MRIVLLEPYMTDSHRAWAEGIQRYSQHEVEILSLPGVQWKWRMHGAAVHFADLLKEVAVPDLILASEMLDLATLGGLLPASWASVKRVVYFHENQLTYPWSANDPDPAAGRDLHYGWIHITSCLAADEVWMNSEYHRQAFLAAADRFLAALPGPLPHDVIGKIRARSKVLPIGIDEETWPKPTLRQQDPPVILWNHRWEYDKGPAAFFEAIFQIKDAGIPFELVVLGKEKAGAGKVFAEAKERLSGQILHWGYAASKSDYHDWLRRCHILPVTSLHDFLGLSVLEAVAAGVLPLLPDRLSYPELFGQHREYFYQSEDEFVSKLKAMLLRPWQQDTALLDTARRFGWGEVIEVYEAAMMQMMVNTNDP